MLTQVTNTITNAVTTFDNYPYNSFAEIGGKYYGVSDDGLFQLDVGSHDGGVIDIATQMKTGHSDFGMRVFKRVEDFYMAMRATGDITLNVYVDEVLIGTYVLSALDVETLKQVRSLIGKGARGRYWQFELLSTDAYDFDAYCVYVVPLSRSL